MSAEEHQGHRARMRKRFMEDRGLAGFSHHEILEMVLFCCYPRTDTNVLAHRLIERFGSIDGVMTAEPAELTASGLVGDSAAQTLSFLSAFSAYLRRGGGEDPVDACDPRAVKEYIRGWFDGETNEAVKIFPINQGQRMMHCIPVSRGTHRDVSFDAREIAAKLLPTGSKALFIAHNHALAACRPSESDIAATRMLIRELRDMGISLIDHFVVGSDGISSFRALGLIYDYE